MADVATYGIHLDGRQYREEAKRVGRSTEELARKTGKSTDKMKKGFKGLTAALGPMKTALISLTAGVSFTAIIKNASNFEKKMAEVSTLLSDTSGIDAMAEGVNNLALAFGNAPVEQAGALYDVISAGAADSAEALETLDAANQLALGGVTDIGTATDGLTSVLNAYGDKVKGATDVSDSFFVAMKAGKTTVGELSGSIGKVAPIAEAAGVSLQEVLAATAALTKGGITTKESITGLRAVLAAVVKPTSEASEMAAKLGLDFNVAAIESKGFAGFMEDVVEKTGGSTDQLALLFTGVEALVPVLRLAGSGAEDFAQIMDDMAARGGATAEAVEKMKQSFSFKLSQFTSSVSVLAQELGTALLPALTVLVQSMTAVIQGIRGLADEFKLLMKLVAIGGGLYLGLKAQNVLYAAMIGKTTLLAAATGGLNAAMFALKGGLATATGALRLFLASLNAVGKAMVVLAVAAAAWEFGKYLHENFSMVRVAGLYMVQSLLVGWERLKQGWESVKAVFTDDTIEAVSDRANERIRKIKDEFGILIGEEIAPTKRVEAAAAGGTPEPETITPPTTPTVDQAAVDAQNKYNNLVAEYTRQATLGSDATQLQRQEYELLNGELKMLTDEQKEHLRVLGMNQVMMDAQAEKDKARDDAIVSITGHMQSMTDEISMINVKTAEEAVRVELTKEKYSELGEEFTGLKEQYIAMGRELDNARFEKEAEALEKALIPAERYADAIEHINLLRERGSLSSEAYQKAIFNEQLRLNETARSARDAMGGFFDDMLTGTVSAKDAFRDMVDSFNASMRRILADKLADMAIKPLLDIMNPVKDPGSGSSGSASEDIAVIVQPTGSPVPVTVTDQMKDTMGEELDVSIEPTGMPVKVEVVGGMCCGGSQAGDYSIGNEIPTDISDALPPSIEGEGGTAAEIVAEESQGVFSVFSDGAASFFDSMKSGASSIWSFLRGGFSSVIEMMGSGLGSVISSIGSLLGSIGGGGGGGDIWSSIISAGIGLFTGVPAAAHGGSLKVPGFADSGQFRVGGSGGIDSQLVVFKATPNETVTVTRPQDDLERFLREKEIMRDLMPSVDGYYAGLSGPAVGLAAKVVSKNMMPAGKVGDQSIYNSATAGETAASISARADYQASGTFDYSGGTANDIDARFVPQRNEFSKYKSGDEISQRVASSSNSNRPIHVTVQVDAKSNTKTARQQGYDIGRNIDRAMRRV